MWSQPAINAKSLTARLGEPVTAWPSPPRRPAAAQGGWPEDLTPITDGATLALIGDATARSRFWDTVKAQLEEGIAQYNTARQAGWPIVALEAYAADEGLPMLRVGCGNGNALALGLNAPAGLIHVRIATNSATTRRYDYPLTNQVRINGQSVADFLAALVGPWLERAE